MVYATVHMNISDNSKMAAYRERANEALERYNGALVAASSEATLLFGETPHQLVGLLSFPNKESALRWKNDPELKSIHDLRQDSGDCNIALIG